MSERCQVKRDASTGAVSRNVMWEGLLFRIAVRHASALVRGLCLCGLLVCTSFARGQTLPAGETAPSDPAADASTAGLPEGTQVRIELEQFGLGNVARAGEWCGVAITIQDLGTAQRQVLVRLSMVDSDGDQPQLQREVTTNPGVKQRVWLYTRLGFDQASSPSLRLTVHEAIDVGAGGGSVQGPSEQLFLAGALLGRLDLRGTGAPRPQESNIALFAVLGQHAYGLKQYSARPDNNSPYLRLGHELTQVITGLTPASMPDRWMGLTQCDTIVWGAGEVSELRGDRAQALVRWVQRGGHLIIVLPPVGQQWMNPASNDIHAIMPTVVVNRRENEAMAGYRPLLTSRLDAIFPLTGVVHTFAPQPASRATDAMPILNGPDGACVVVRRIVGNGAVTMVGLDLNATRLSQSDTIEADVFWHRILGRRGELLPESIPNQGLSERSPRYVDSAIASEIAITGRSAIGALVGFVVFGLYWIVAGPGLFFLLRRNQQHKHSWVAFMAGGLLFATLSWGLATFLRPQRVQATHLTILDHVYGQPTQRARMWTSVLIPTYGNARVSVGDTTGESADSLSALAPWDAPGDEAGRIGSFPDARGYQIDARSPDAASIPVRATIKTLQVDWAGAPTWRMITPQTVNGLPGTIELNPAWEAATAAASGTPMLTGVLTHGLPEPLLNGRVIIVRTISDVRGTVGRFPLMAAFEFLLPSTWAPDEAFDLGVETRRAQPKPLITRLDSLLPAPANLGTISAFDGYGSLPNQLDALTMFGILPPPDFSVQQGGFNFAGYSAAQRRATHGFDLSRWFTQPCVIITGFLGDPQRVTPSPVPFFVDGEAVETQGLTFVRWVYPLPPQPPSVIDADKQVGRRRAAIEGALQDLNALPDAGTDAANQDK